MVSKASIVSMWRLLAAFNPENGAGLEDLRRLRDLVMDIACMDLTGQTTISSDELVAMSFIYDRLGAIIALAEGRQPAIDAGLGGQAAEQGFIDEEHELASSEAAALAERDGLLFRIWALSQVEQVLEHLGEEEPGEEAL
ncbi:MAG: hypothetical protein JW909_07655 [Planctomycetes bacterium]|nr:hypothetical protein [Planctomycetota bacterium]